MRANVEKMNQAVKGHPELLQKIEAETQRLKNTGEAKNAEEAAVKAVKAVLDIDLDAEDLKALTQKNRELDLDEQENVSGGSALFDVFTGVYSFFTGVGGQG